MYISEQPFSRMKYRRSKISFKKLSDSTQDHPKFKPYVWECCPKPSLNSGGSGLSPGHPVPCPPPSGEEPFPDIQPAPPLHAIPSSPVAVTQSRAQRCSSAPCEELQPPCSAQSTPQVVRQFPAVQNRGQWAGRVMRKWVCSLEDRICYLQQDKDPKAHFLTEGRPRISEGPVGVWGSCKPWCCRMLLEKRWQPEKTSWLWAVADIHLLLINLSH